MKKLILFLGGPKCGSSAIQGLLFFNRARLFKLNQLIYVDKNFGRDINLATSHSRMLSKLQSTDYSDMCVIFRNLSLSMSEGESCIFATEGLCKLNYIDHYANLFSGASKYFSSIEIIIYVRNQVEFIHSAWKQWGIKHKVYDMNDYVGHCLKKDFGNWLRIIDAYKKIPKSNIIVRPFQGILFKDKNIVNDFMSQINISNSFIEQNPQHNVNISLDDFTMNACINACRIHGIEPLKLIKYIKKEFNIPPMKLDYLMDSKISSMISAHFASSNTELVSKYGEDLEAIFSGQYLKNYDGAKFNPKDCLERYEIVQKAIQKINTSDYC